MERQGEITSYNLLYVNRSEYIMSFFHCFWAEASVWKITWNKKNLCYNKYHIVRIFE